MSTGEGADARDERDQQDHGRRGERIGIGGGDDSVTRIQLAARWAESYGPATDSLGGILRAFRTAYEYLDAVTHGVEPPDLQDELTARPAPQPVPAPSYAPPPAQPPYQPPAQPTYQPQPAPPYAPPSPPPAPPQPEPRPWG